MSKPIFVHVPYAFLRENLQLILERRLNPEIFIPGPLLDSLLPEELRAIADGLASEGLSCTMHGPFMDLNPGSAEPLLRQATLHRFNQALDAAAILKPRVMVLHPGYDRWRYGEAQEIWLANCIDTFSRIIPRIEEIGSTVAVENIFEEEPSTLKALLEEIDSPLVRHCFDVGHWNLFAKVTMEEWFEEMGRFVAETHIHDNGGTRDDHAPPGDGAIDFDLFFRLMKLHAPNAAWTIEAHSREALERALPLVGRHAAGESSGMQER